MALFKLCLMACIVQMQLGALSLRFGHGVNARNTSDRTRISGANAVVEMYCGMVAILRHSGGGCVLTRSHALKCIVFRVRRCIGNRHCVVLGITRQQSPQGWRLMLLGEFVRACVKCALCTPSMG